MTLIVSADTAGTHSIIDEGTHIARCVWVIDLGTQETDFGPKKKVLIGWELPAITRTYEGQAEPAIVSKFYTACLSEKSNLRRDLELWRGRVFAPAELEGFNLAKLLGVPCLLTITHRANAAGERKAVVAGIAKIVAGMEVPSQLHPSKLYDLDDPDHSAFASFPSWLQDQIRKSAQWKALSGDSPR